MLYPILLLVLLYMKKKVTCINFFTGGVTNTAQYQNRLMVYDPKQVGICVVCVFSSYVLLQTGLLANAYNDFVRPNILN